VELRDHGFKLTVAPNRGGDGFFFRAIDTGTAGHLGDARYNGTLHNPFMFSQLTQEWWYWSED
jgi:hypothetical protein